MPEPKSDAEESGAGGAASGGGDEAQHAVRAAAPPANGVVVPAFNEASIEQALLDAHGDLFIASQLLGHVTVLKLDRAIRASDRLQNVFLEIKAVVALPEYDRLSQAQLEKEIARRMTMYRTDALESLHQLATMDTTDNSAMAQVKLAAAARLSGPLGDTAGSSDIERTLRELNEQYHLHAPRIKVTRTTIEVSGGERVIEGEASESLPRT